MIRSSTLSLAHYNKAKQAALDLFVSAYRKAVEDVISFLWNNRVEWGGLTSKHVWDRSCNLLELPTMISTVGLPIDSPLSARALKCAATQACGIIGSVVHKRCKDLARASCYTAKGMSIPESLIARLGQEMTKPSCQSINCELNSIVATFALKKRATSYDGWISLASLFKPEIYGRGFKLQLPVNLHRQFKKWADGDAQQMPSLLLGTNQVTIRFKQEVPLRAKGKTVAIDQGLVTCLTTSDGQISKKDIHGHDLCSIITQMSKCVKGSKGFERKVAHRKNYINWAVKQLTLSGISEIRLEQVININFRKSVGRKLAHWTNTLIRDSLQKRCEEAGVLLTLVPNEFNSQRCSCCGWTQKANRQGKMFKCHSCGVTADADYNASQNILIRDTLVDIPYGFRWQKFNLAGFYWKPEGLFIATGEELTVSHGRKTSEHVCPCS